MKAGSSGFSAAAIFFQRGDAGLVVLRTAASASDSDFSFGWPIIEHRRIVDHQDPFQVRQPVGDLQDLVDIFLIFGDEDRGAAVLHLEFDFGDRGGRIDAVDDAAGGLRAPCRTSPIPRRRRP